MTKLLQTNEQSIDIIVTDAQANTATWVSDVVLLVPAVASGNGNGEPINDNDPVAPIAIAGTAATTAATSTTTVFNDGNQVCVPSGNRDVLSCSEGFLNDPIDDSDPVAPIATAGTAAVTTAATSTTTVFNEDGNQVCVPSSSRDDANFDTRNFWQRIDQYGKTSNTCEREWCLCEIWESFRIANPASAQTRHALALSTSTERGLTHYVQADVAATAVAAAATAALCKPQRYQPSAACRRGMQTRR